MMTKSVNLFIPCFINQLFPSVGWDTIKILEKAGVKVEFNPEQTCCGQPHFNSGYWKDSAKMAKKFIDLYSNNLPIIIPSASCAGYIINHYEKHFEKNQEYIKSYLKIKENIIELTDYLVNHLRFTDFGSSFPHRITYHDSCSALREYGIEKEPRTLLNKVKNLTLTEMNERDVCCGFGGTFMTKFIPISTAMVQQKVENALQTGAEYIVSSEASCLININSYIEKNNIPIKTAHIATVLASF